MTQERSPERRRPPAGREGVEKKVLRVSHRKELAVVTLGMVAAISGVGGFLAENPPSWATGVESATTTQQTAQQQTRGEATGQGTVRRALQRANGQKETARGAAARVVPARKESGQAARRQQQAVFSTQPKASDSTASASAVSRGS
ncbi:MAG TPA: hypothetical protein VF068_07795 [Rubrobacter sp.]